MANPQSANTNAPWRFNGRLKFITHDTDQCNICAPWVQHFLSAVVLGDETLAEAEQKRDIAIQGSLPRECTDLRENLNTICAEMTAVRHNFDNARRKNGHMTTDLNEATDKIRRLRAQLDDAHKTIAHLRDKIAQNDREQMTGRRKIARQRGTTPSPSRSSSQPDSPMQEVPVAGSSRPPQRSLTTRLLAYHTNTRERVTRGAKLDRKEQTTLTELNGKKCVRWDESQTRTG